MQRLLENGIARVNSLFDDVLALSLMVVTFTTLNAGRIPGDIEEFLGERLTLKNVALAIVFMTVWHVCFAVFGLYRRSPGSLLANAVRIVLACSAASLALTVFTLASRSGAFGLTVIASFWAVAVVIELLGRTAIALAARYATHHAREIKNVVIVGSGPRAIWLDESIRQHHPRDYVVLGFVDTRGADEVPDEIRPRLLGTLQQFEMLLSTQPIDQVLIALPVKSQYSAIQNVIEACERVGVEAKYFPDLFPVSRARRAFEQEGALPGVLLQLVVDDYRLVVKRVIDVIGALTGLIVLLPVMAACAIAIRATSPGPVFFSQPRYGRNRRLFSMHKFRTMVQDAESQQAILESRNEANGPLFKIRSDPRVTPVGRWMRRLSLDELPQLFNVLTGEMSLVGPRPLPVRDVSRFSETRLLRRFSVKPGLTCLWQINGRSNVEFEDWVRLDLDYIDNWSLRMDARILLKTVPVVLSGSGAM
jgi:exopolysaccharide biosynthesis polyprenyl glycosylphosphotransferase